VITRLRSSLYVVIPGFPDFFFASTGSRRLVVALLLAFPARRRALAEADVLAILKSGESSHLGLETYDACSRPRPVRWRIPQRRGDEDRDSALLADAISTSRRSAIDRERDADRTRGAAAANALLTIPNVAPVSAACSLVHRDPKAYDSATPCRLRWRG